MYLVVIFSFGIAYIIIIFLYYNCNLKYLENNSIDTIRSLTNKFIKLKKKRITTKLQSILFNIKLNIICVTKKKG